METNLFNGLRKVLKKLTCCQPSSSQNTAFAAECITRLSFFSSLNSSISSLGQGSLVQQIPTTAQKPSIPSLDSIFHIKNLSTGQVIHLQDQTTPSFVGRLSELLECKEYTEALNHFDRQSDRVTQALREATINNQPELCQLLLSKEHYGDLRAQVNTIGEEGLTVLHIAAMSNYSRVCEVLLDYGDNTNLNPLNNSNQTPLHLACIEGHLETSQLLIRSGANITPVDIHRKTPLLYARQSGNQELVRWLLNRNPDLNLENSELELTESEIDIEELMPRLPQPISLSPQRVEIQNRPQTKLVSPVDFNPIQLIGKGSFGDVYLVQKNDTKELFAMKILKKSMIFGKNIVKYALTERNVLSYVKHPFIVSLRFALQTENKLFLILDYCPGGDLGKQISRQKRLNQNLSRIYLAQIVLALEELHKRDIIYRDLKPDNVVIDEQGHALLTDFGLSKQGITNHYQAKSFCGSVAYLAPEILKRTGHGKATDWYLLGVLLYQMLVGVPPYYTRDKNQLFQNIKTAKLKIPKSLSVNTKDILKKLLHRKPAKRLGAVNDAEEIKEHPFFEGISWEAVYRRELRPPRPQKAIIAGFLPMERIVNMESLQDTSENHILGWTFVMDC